MLERDGALVTWRLMELPEFHGAQSNLVDATRLANHRLAYLDYEGEVSGNRGRVDRVDRGELEWLKVTPDAFAVRLRGDLFHGDITLARVDGACWRLTLLTRNQP